MGGKGICRTSHERNCLSQTLGRPRILQFSFNAARAEPEGGGGTGGTDGKGGKGGKDAAKHMLVMPGSRCLLRAAAPLFGIALPEHALKHAGYPVCASFAAISLQQPNATPSWVPSGPGGYLDCGLRRLSCIRILCRARSTPRTVSQARTARGIFNNSPSQDMDRQDITGMLQAPFSGAKSEGSVAPPVPWGACAYDGR